MGEDLTKSHTVRLQIKRNAFAIRSEQLLSSEEEIRRAFPDF